MKYLVPFWHIGADYKSCWPGIRTAKQISSSAALVFFARVCGAARVPIAATLCEALEMFIADTTAKQCLARHAIFMVKTPFVTCYFVWSLTRSPITSPATPRLEGTVSYPAKAVCTTFLAFGMASTPRFAICFVLRRCFISTYRLRFADGYNLMNVGFGWTGQDRQIYIQDENAKG
jgi:hypothetical protein